MSFFVSLDHHSPTVVDTAAATAVVEADTVAVVEAAEVGEAITTLTTAWATSAAASAPSTGPLKSSPTSRKTSMSRTSVFLLAQTAKLRTSAALRR